MTDYNNHEVNKFPIFYNEHADKRIHILDELIDKVGDDQKEVLETERKFVEIGLDGERNVIYELMHSKQPIVFIHDVTLENIYHDSQIDFIVICRNCIIVIESKKLIGDIRINKEGNFVRNFKNANGIVYKKEGIYSPVTQNKYHIDALEELLHKNNLLGNLPIYSLIVIANPKTIINKKNAPMQIKNQVVKYDLLNDAITSLIKSTTSTHLNDKQMLDIAKCICDNNIEKEYDYIKKYNLKFIKDEQINKVEVIDKNEKIIQKSDDSMYEALVAYRSIKAKEKNLPIHYIFSNDILSELVLKKPTNKEEFIAISGLGEKKYEQYGEDIIKILNAHEIVYDIEPEKKVMDKEKLEADLRTYRTKKSKELNHPAYYIFTNEELVNLLEKLPNSIEELSDILTPIKVKIYGKDILEIINQYR